MPEVRIVNLTKRYGKVMANDQVNLTIKDREYVSVIGPSGCGKTTLIKSIAGIIQPEEGEIFLDGKSISEVPIEDRGIGYVFQNIALFPHMNVWDNIVYGPRVRGISPEVTRPLALEMLEMIKLSTRSDAFPNELSGGTRQKTAVARALVSKAKLLLLDEPLGALDLKVRTELRYELRKLVKDLKLTALHVTHDQEEAMSISDRVIVMKKGKIVEDGQPMSLYARPRNIFTANFVGEANFLRGIITKIKDGETLIEIGKDTKLTSSNVKGETGDRVVIAFRPEYVSLGNNLKTNQLSAHIEDILYSGSIVRVRIRLASNETIVAKTDRFDRTIYKIGDEIIVCVPSDNVLAYSYPKEGLEKEIALE